MKTGMLRHLTAALAGLLLTACGTTANTPPPRFGPPFSGLPPTVVGANAGGPVTAQQVIIVPSTNTESFLKFAKDCQTEGEARNKSDIFHDYAGEVKELDLSQHFVAKLIEVFRKRHAVVSYAATVSEALAKADRQTVIAFVDVTTLTAGCKVEEVPPFVRVIYPDLTKIYTSVAVTDAAMRPLCNVSSRSHFDDPGAAANAVKRSGENVSDLQHLNGGLINLAMTRLSSDAAACF